MFDRARVRSNIQHLLSHPNDYKTNIFGFETIRATFHTCFVPLTSVYKT